MSRKAIQEDIMEDKEKERIAANIAIYMKWNGYTERTFAQATKLSQATLKAITTNKTMKPVKFKKYVEKISANLGLDNEYFTREQAEITAAPIQYSDENKLHLGDEKLSAISLLLKISEIHYK
ncbi:hypothetical protein HMPREF0556_11605 [Listeria grayi DSM 20601]|uniref:HTH cro/C1-type domain-containing protein n=2 Tax=Listeria grayi TaxID=1641 RepID=D7UZS5_LISGR|nr:hypothetical protein HMPREF0556_11605 [Listeria grayi DSM 20601]